MKSWLTRLFLTVMLVMAIGLLAACGGDDDGGEDSVDQEQQEAGQAADEAGDSIGEAAEDTGQAIEESGEAVAAAGAESAEEAGEAIEEGAEETGDVLEEGGEAVVGALEEGAEEAGQAADEAGEALEEGAAETGEQLEEAGEEVGEAADEAGQELEESAQNADENLEAAGEQLEQAGEDVEDAAGNVGDAAEEVGIDPEGAAEDVEEAAEDTGEAIEEGVDEAGEAIEDIDVDMPDVDLDDVDVDLTPNVISVRDQVVTDNTLTVDGVVDDGPGFLVAYADDGSGQPGQVIGYEQVNEGENRSIDIQIDPMIATPTVIVQLVDDTGQEGVFEPDVDTPAADEDNQAIAAIFNVTIVAAPDQFAMDAGQVTVDSVTVHTPAWLVVHADDGDDDESTFGPMLGQVQLNAGTSNGVAVPIDAANTTETLWLVIHEDAGTQGTFEEDADPIVSVNDNNAARKIWTVPHVRVPDGQLVESNDRIPADMAVEGPALLLDTVLSNAAGFVAVHADDSDAPGAVLGFAPIQQGLTPNVVVPIDTANLTDTVWVMLHEDTDANGEFDENADAPVMQGEAPVMSSAEVKMESGEE